GARGGVLGHAEGDHLVQGGRDGGVGGRGAGGVGHEVAVHLLGGFGVAVGAAAGEGFEQHAGQGVDVGAGVGVPGEPLGGHVGPGADGQAGGGDRGLTEGAGDAEIDEIGPAVWADQDVGGLDVAVHQARRV